MDVGERLHALRVARDLTQDGLSEASGVPQATISQIERGRTPRAETLTRLAGALRVRVEELTGASTQSERPSLVREELLTLVEHRLSPREQRILLDLARLLGERTQSSESPAQEGAPPQTQE